MQETNKKSNKTPTGKPTFFYDDDDDDGNEERPKRKLKFQSKRDQRLALLKKKLDKEADRKANEGDVSSVDEFDLLDEVEPEQIASLKYDSKHTMYKLIESLNHTTCQFCFGWGHVTKNCSTLKQINKIAKSSKDLKSAWGYMKSDYIRLKVKEATDKGVAGRSKQTLLGKRKQMGKQLQNFADSVEGTNKDRM